MPLPTPAARKLKHTRRVICEGYEREDGLWDIEAFLLDTKSFDLQIRDLNPRTLPAGEALHGMSIRITVDLELNILDAVATMDHTPFKQCPAIASAYRQLIGLKIQPGFTKQTKALFAGRSGCTHLLELLGPLATAAFQSTHQEREKAANFWQDSDERPPLLDTCHALAADGPIVKKHWPHYHQGNQPEAIPVTNLEQEPRCNQPEPA
ncbi:DUF2889 domain-containing protein [Neptuniibacter halophilus]|uniref:DUF2889 domain-containing protein n=1 Tax=Neptuniibacter halophilus TaxID=651666 RepID=UPI00257365EB|nr:DUF2889 domain-containing protein [Neptuniibacter halophilus]